MFARKLRKGITLEMYIRNTQVNKKKKRSKEQNFFLDYFLSVSEHSKHKRAQRLGLV